MSYRPDPTGFFVRSTNRQIFQKIVYLQINIFSIKHKCFHSKPCVFLYFFLLLTFEYIFVMKELNHLCNEVLQKTQQKDEHINAITYEQIVGRDD